MAALGLTGRAMRYSLWKGTNDDGARQGLALRRAGLRRHRGWRALFPFRAGGADLLTHARPAVLSSRARALPVPVSTRANWQMGEGALRCRAPRNPGAIQGLGDHRGARDSGRCRRIVHNTWRSSTPTPRRPGRCKIVGVAT